jgi:basic amino acid/polyamine antiporter, APA family
MKPTLGLTGLTSNAMALIAPGAFLWLTFAEQSQYGAPSAGSAMWMGMLLATLLCLATAVSYAELSKLYPGAGSSYFFAEQAFLSKKQIYKWARAYKFMVGWASHLYYWVYPGVMVCVTSIFIGYMAGQLFPSKFTTAENSPILMIVFCVIFSFGVSYIAFRGVVGATGVNVAINIIQITALLIFSCMAITHRAHVKEGMTDYTLDSTGTPNLYQQDTIPATTPNGTATPKVDANGNPVVCYFVCDKNGNVIQANGTGDTVIVDSKGNVTPDSNASDSPVQIPTDATGNPTDSHWVKSKDGMSLTLGAATTQPATLAAGTVAKAAWNCISYKGGMVQDSNNVWQFNYHDSATSVIHWHKGSYILVQGCIAILCLVGFESVTSMGEEAKNPKKHIPIAVVASLLIQGGFCYLFEYFAANYFQSSLYTNQTASGSSAPIGDMMQLVGAWAFGTPSAGWWFMFWEAITVFLAMIGTTLSCINTGARVTYAMGRDEEVPNHFGLLHGKNNTPHRCIWTLAIISIVIGIYGVIFYLCGPGASSALDSNLTDAQKASMWYKGVFGFATAQNIPNSLLIITLISNFGTFMLYMMSCIVAMVAFHEHHLHNPIKHILIPGFGLLANLACMIFYVVGPFFVPGMSKKEPLIALGFAAVWGIYGLIYFLMRSKKTGKELFVSKPPAAATV